MSNELIINFWIEPKIGLLESGKLTMRKKIVAATTVALFFISGCAEIPGDDIAFLDRKIPVGMDTAQAREIISRRRFMQVDISAIPKNRFDHASRSFTQLPLNETDIAKQNIGMVGLVGEPRGQLACFAREYQYVLLFASGHRLICWTEDDDNKITWRQAGWRGATL